MDYVILGVIWVLGTGFAWRRILSCKYSWLKTAVSLVFTLIPIAGPIFYLLIEPPESTPIAVRPEEFWHTRKSGGRPWPSFDPLIKSLHRIFTGGRED